MLRQQNGLQHKGRNTPNAFLKRQTLQKRLGKVWRAKHSQDHQAVLPGAYEAELRAQPAWAECDIDEQCASAPFTGKLRIVQLLSASKKRVWCVSALFCREKAHTQGAPYHRKQYIC